MSNSQRKTAPLPPEPFPGDAPLQVPYNQEAEESLIGSVMIDPEVLRSLDIEAEDFYLVRHQMIWTAFRELQRRQIHLDFTTVSDELDRQGNLSEVGGPAYLTSIISAVPTSLHAESYAGIVIDKAARRLTIEAAQSLLQAAYDESVDLETSVGEIVGELSATASASAGSAHSSSEIHDEFMNVVKDPFKSISTGLSVLDRTLGKFFMGEMTILAARPGVGKTALAAQIARSVAQAKHRVLFFSTEMNEISWWGRFAAPLAGVSWQELRSMDSVDPILLQKIEAASASLKAAYGDYLRVNDKARRPNEMRRIARRYKPELVIVDHLGEMEWMKPNLKPIEWYGLATTYLRDKIAKDTLVNCHVLLVAQLNRAVESRQDKTPQLQDLRETGRLEEIGDAVIMGYRPDMYNPDKYLGVTEVSAEWWTRKNRFGKVNNCANLVYDMFLQWFNSPTAQRP